MDLAGWHQDTSALCARLASSPRHAPTTKQKRRCKAQYWRHPPHQQPSQKTSHKRAMAATLKTAPHTTHIARAPVKVRGAGPREEGDGKNRRSVSGSGSEPVKTRTLPPKLGSKADFEIKTHEPKKKGRSRKTATGTRQTKELKSPMVVPGLSAARFFVARPVVIELTHLNRPDSFGRNNAACNRQKPILKGCEITIIGRLER